MIQRYCRHIRFDRINPGTMALCMDTINFRSDADLQLTLLPEDDLETKVLLKELIDTIPRMSTLAIAAIIGKCIDMSEDGTAFVNVGVWHGFSFLSQMVLHPKVKCIGVDNFSEFGGPKAEFMERFEKWKSENHLFYEMDYRDYFKGVTEIDNTPLQIGVYLYDGAHDEESQYNGLKVAEPFLIDGAYVIIDDVNLEDAVKGTVRFMDESEYEYKCLTFYKTANNMHPTFWNGIAVFQKTGLKQSREEKQASS